MPGLFIVQWVTTAAAAASMFNALYEQAQHPAIQPSQQSGPRPWQVNYPLSHLVRAIL